MRLKHLPFTKALTMKALTFLASAAFAVSIFSAGVANASTVNGFANGGFELEGTGIPAQSWLNAASGYTRSTDAFEGNFSAQLSSPELNAAVVLQNSIEQGNLPPLTAGDIPEFSFQSKGFAGTTGNVLFSLRFLSDGGDILYTSGNQFFQSQINPNTWTEITFTPDAVPVGATAAFVEFSQAIGPINGTDLLGGAVLIDSVRLSVTSAIPEPTSAAMLALGGLGLLTQRRRRS